MQKVARIKTNETVFIFADFPEADQVPGDLPLEQHGPPAQAAARPLPLQPLPMDTHPSGRAGQPQRIFLFQINIGNPDLIWQLAGEALLVPGHGVPVGHADLLERAARLHRPADDAHAQVLLLDRKPSGPHGNRAQGKTTTSDIPIKCSMYDLSLLHFT